MTMALGIPSLGHLTALSSLDSTISTIFGEYKTQKPEWPCEILGGTSEPQNNASFYYIDKIK